MTLLFFSKSKPKFIDVTCPSCGHVQNEPAIVVSTCCRKCQTNFKIDEGQSVKSKLNEKTSGLPDSVPVRDKEEVIKVEQNFEIDGKPVATSAKPWFKAKPMKADGLKRRSVSCFTCKASHEALATASSTLCPKCGAYIALEDYDIRGKWNRHIKTRGNVVVHKKGLVSGVSIHCHDLTIHGDIMGGVDCSGDFTITRHGKILGRVNCKRLIISKKAEVEFVNQVFCDSVEIDGHATGDIVCKGKVNLSPKSELVGDVVASSLAISEGAKHHGGIKTYTPEPAKNPIK